MRQRLSTIYKNMTRIFSTKQLPPVPMDCYPHMNELPVPCGPWEPWYKAQQSFFTKHLAVGFIWWAFSLGMALSSDTFHFDLWGRPAQPGPPSDMVEDCDDSD